MKSKFFIVVLLLFNCKKIQSQEINGIWIGNYSKTTGLSKPEKIIIDINSVNDSVIYGTSHLEYFNNQFEHYRITGIYNRTQAIITFTEDSLLNLRLTNNYKLYYGVYSLKLKSDSNSLFLIGKWEDKNEGLFSCPSSSVWLEKKTLRKCEKRDSNTIKIDTLLNRKADIQSLVEINKKEKDSIKVEVYDNAIVDGDSVSIFFNDSIIVAKKMITLNAIVFYVSLNKEHSISKIKLAAESLGIYPPCTATMIITTKTKRYEVALSSDFNKNAVAELFLKDE